MSREPRPGSVGVRLLVVLLRLYPSGFRHEYEGDVRTALSEHWTNVRRSRGVLGLIRLSIRTAADLLLGAPVEWMRGSRGLFGGHKPIKKFSRKKGDSLMRSIVQDTRLALRALIRQPSFAVIAIATLALGIGANTAIFSLVNRVLLEPLPYPNADELVRIWSSNPAQERGRYFTSPLSFHEWRARTESFTEIAAAWPRDVTMTDDVDSPTRLNTMSVTPNWFDALGVAPQIGRLFLPEDAGIAWGSWVLVLSDGLWRDRFGADPHVIGTVARIDGQPAEVIGVLPPGVGFPETADLFTNFLPPRTQSAQYMDVVARMKPGVTNELATSELSRVAVGLEQEFPESLAGWGVDVAPLYEVVVGDVRPALLTLLVATGLVLAIACANVANLLLTRTERRMKELAVRSALGAGRRRLVRQLLTESIVLGGVGAMAGIVVAFASLRALIGIVPASLPRFDGVQIDVPMLGITMASALLTGLAFGLAPALQLLSVDMQSELKDGGQRTAGSVRGRWMRNTFVVGQMALAVVVSVGAGLLIKSFANLRSTDPGFTTTGVTTFELDFPSGDYPDLSTVSDGYGRILERLSELPGVVQVGATSTLPLTDDADFLLELSVVGETPPEPGSEPFAWYRMVSENFFDAAGVSLVRGRRFDGRDRADAPAVVIVNRSLARTLFGESDPIGRQLSGTAGSFGPLGFILNSVTEIVGVVDDVRYGSLREAAAPSLYFPIQQAPFRRMSIAVRTAGDAGTIVGAARREIQAFDPTLAVGNVATMQNIVERSIARDRFAMLLVTLFGAVALTLAAVGIYGVLSHTVAQRTRELGVRIALGATSSRVLSLVMMRTVLLVGSGLGLGLLGSVAATRAISSQLFGVTARDPITFGMVTVLLAVVGLIASYVPAARATRISPVTALRHE